MYVFQFLIYNCTILWSKSAAASSAYTVFASLITTIKFVFTFGRVHDLEWLDSPATQKWHRKSMLAFLMEYPSYSRARCCRVGTP